jgi:hypothetical protein
MTLLLCIFVMVVSIRTYLNVGILLLQIAFAGTILAVSLSLQHVKSNDERSKNHAPTLLFVAAVGGLTVGGGLFSLSLTWCTCLVKYGRIVDLRGIILNLAAGSVRVCIVLVISAEKLEAARR